MMNTPSLADRDGFTLVEAMLAMVLAAVIVMSLAPALLYVAQQQRAFVGSTQADGVLLGVANRMTTTPFEDLPEEDECVTVDSGRFPHTRCITVLESSNGNRTLTVVVTPLHSAMGGADTVVVQRRRPKKNPFKQGGPN